MRSRLLSRLCTLLAVAAISVPTTASVIISVRPLFPADNVWNVAIDTLPVDANSAPYIATIGAPLMNQLLPLSARNMPYFFNARRMTWTLGPKEAISTDAFRRNRWPIGG